MLKILFKCGIGLWLLALTGCSTVHLDTNTPVFQHQYEAHDYCGIKAVKQTTDNSCGSACLTSVANYWGVDITEQQILIEFPKAVKEQYPILDLRDIAKSKGLDAYVFSMSENPLEQLQEQLLKGRPLICAVYFPRSLYFAYDVPVYGFVYRKLLWSLGPRRDHYVVVFGINSEELLIMDPARGFVVVSQKQFESGWNKKNHAALICGSKSKTLSEGNPDF